MRDWRAFNTTGLNIRGHSEVIHERMRACVRACVCVCSCAELAMNVLNHASVSLLSSTFAGVLLHLDLISLVNATDAEICNL